MDSSRLSLSGGERYRSEVLWKAAGLPATLRSGGCHGVEGLGDSVDALDHRFTVLEMDGRRVARVRITLAA